MGNGPNICNTKKTAIYDIDCITQNLWGYICVDASSAFTIAAAVVAVADVSFNLTTYLPS